MHWLSFNDHQTKWLITIPGDTPFIPMNIVAQFKSKMSKQTKIILAQSGKKTHPIIGAWHTSLFSDLNENLDKGTRKILTWAHNHPIEYINFGTKPYDPFFNINFKEDITEAARIDEFHTF